MKKIKENGINRKNFTYLKKMAEINDTFIVDIIMSNMKFTDLKIYFPAESYELSLIALKKALIKKDKIVNVFLSDLVKINELNIKDYLEIGLEELKFEYDKDISPALHNIKAISPDMMIFHYITQELEEDERYKISIEIFKKKNEEYIESIKNKNEKEIIIKGLEKSTFENELNAFFRKEIKSLGESFEKKILDLCARYDASYINEKLILNPYILLFYDEKAKEIVNTRETLNDLLDISYVSSYRNFIELKRNIKKNINFEQLYTENDKLKLSNALLEKEIKFLNEKEKEISKRNNTEDLLNLSKENYYLKTKIEQLEAELREAEEELENIKNIKENLILEEIEIPKKIDCYTNQSIIIIGGKWDSKRKVEAQNKYIVDFVTSEDAFRNSKRYKNYDIVIFDTSRNSHTNFYKLKSIVKNYFLINKSEKDSIDKLFVK